MNLTLVPPAAQPAPGTQPAAASAAAAAPAATAAAVAKAAGARPLALIMSAGEDRCPPEAILFGAAVIVDRARLTDAYRDVRHVCATLHEVESLAELDWHQVIELSGAARRAAAALRSMVGGDNNDQQGLKGGV